MKRFIGKHVIVRANEAGVFFGVLESIEGRNIILKNTRKLFRWEGANTVEQIALEGVSKPDNCKFTQSVENVGIANFCQILPCTQEAVENIEKVKVWKY